MEALLRRYVSGFSANPTIAEDVLRQGFETDRLAFNKAAAASLRQCVDSPGYRHLLTMLIEDDVVLRWLCHPSFFTRDEAVRIAKELSRIDPRMDARLLEMAISSADDTEFTATIRMLDILSETSDVLGIMGKLAQLSRHGNRRVRSKAILLMGRRNKSHKWVSGILAESDPRTRANALESLWGVDTEGARAVLREALGDGNNRAVGNAVAGLYRLGDPTSIGFMRRLLVHADALFQSTGLWAIEQSKDIRFIPVLEHFPSEAHPLKLKVRASQVLKGLREKAATLAKRPAVRLLVHGLQTDPDTGWTTLGLSVQQESRPMLNLQCTDLALFHGSTIVEDYQVRELAASEPAALGFLIPHPIARAAGNPLINAALAALKLRRDGDEWAAVRYRSGKPASSTAPAAEQPVTPAPEPGLPSEPLERTEEKDASAPTIFFSGEDRSIEGMLAGKEAREICVGSLTAGILALSAAHPEQLKCHIVVLLDESSEAPPVDESEHMRQLVQDTHSVLHVISRKQSEFGRSLAVASGGRYHQCLSPDRFHDAIESVCAALAGGYEIQFRTDPPVPPSSIVVQVAAENGIGRVSCVA
jgi:HEAT repeat protein